MVDSTASGRVPVAPVATVAGVAVAATAIAALHVVGAGTVDPVATTVSDYVALPEGPALFGLATTGMLVAGVALALVTRGVPRMLFGIWCAAVVLVAVFPTNLPGDPIGVSAQVHRWAGAVLFAVPPVAGLVLCRARAGGLRAPGWTALAAAGTAAFLLAHGPHVMLGTPALGWVGVVERVALATHLALLTVLATRAGSVATDRIGPAAAPAGQAAPTGRAVAT